MDERDLADRAADVVLSAPEQLAKGFFDYKRYRVTVHGAEQTRDVVRVGKVAAVLPVDLARDEIVLIRQFRLSAHVANGRGALIETVAGRVEAGEAPEAAARRECAEEIGVAPTKMVELFSYLTTPGLTDEEVVVFLAGIDATQAAKSTATEGEQIETLRVSIDAALAALRKGRLHNGPLVIALQWLALNRDRLAELLGERPAG